MAANILRLLCVFFSVVMILLCGCAPKNAPAPSPADGFRADFSAEYRGMRLSGELTHTRQGVCAMRLTAPDTLEGLTIRFQDNTVALRRGGAAATADEPYLAPQSFPAQVFAALQTAADGAYSKADDGALTLHGSRGTLRLDANGVPRLLLLPGDSAVTFFNGEPLE